MTPNAPSTAPHEAPASYRGCHILIVDDDRDDHLFLKMALSEVMPQASVKSLYDGADALSYLDRCNALPQLIFMDLNMRKTSGKTTTRRIRENHSLDQVPLIILSTSNVSAEKKELIDLGASDFYTKPYNINELVAIVRTVKSNWLKPVN